MLDATDNRPALAPRPLLEACERDPALRAYLAAEVRHERNRINQHRRECGERPGVRRAGSAPEPFRPRTTGEMIAAARRRLEESRAWRGSADGRLFARLADVEGLLAACAQTHDMARSTHARGMAHVANRSAMSLRLDEMAACGRRIVAACAAAAADLAALAPTLD